MLNKYAAVFAAGCLLVAIPAMNLAQDAATTVLSNAAKAMGSDNLRTIQFSGMGSTAGVGQNRNPNASWPVVRVKTYNREIDFGAATSQMQMVRVQGGAEETRTQHVSQSSPWSSQFSFWLTPFGFIKGAMANNATLKSETIEGKKYDVVTFVLQNRYKVVGYINENNLVDRVQTWIDSDVLGDMLAESWFSDYKDFGGVKFPTMIVEKQGGFAVLILAVSEVKPNAPVNIQAPPAAAIPAVQTAAVETEKVADGVFYLRGGSHHSVAIEFADHVAVIEGPLNEQRSLAVIAEVGKLIPGKPIRYLVNTHHHFDHSGGIRAYVAEGAAIVTHEINREFYEKALSTPRTLNPDRLAQTQNKARIETVGDKKVLSDETRTLELHLIKGNPHNDGILMAFLPKEKLLIEADVYTRPAAGAFVPAPVNPNTVNTVEMVEKLKLEFERVLPLHGPGAATRLDLYAAVGKPAPDLTALASPIAASAALVRGRKVLDTACTGCHNLNRVENKNLSLTDWQTVVERMKGRGAELSDDDSPALLDYLVKSYGPK